VDGLTTPKRSGKKEGFSAKKGAQELTWLRIREKIFFHSYERESDGDTAGHVEGQATTL
jgi:hypothetical protein